MPSCSGDEARPVTSLEAENLYESDPQYREKAAMWRILSLLPLYAPLAQGRIWRWFAANIPMDLGTGGSFNSDIDLIARLNYFPLARDVWFFRTWEVKVALLGKDGNAHSLKAGKLSRLMNQLGIYREFGAPDVSLLDVFVCEPGFLQTHPFPTPKVSETLTAKFPSLRGEGFGYYALAFQLAGDSAADPGLSSLIFGPGPAQTVWNPLPPRGGQPTAGFAQLMARLVEFFESSPDRPSKNFHQIVFCRACRQLQLIRMRDEHVCPACRDDLIKQF
jgi:hypothetical protein